MVTIRFTFHVLERYLHFNYSRCSSTGTAIATFDGHTRTLTKHNVHAIAERIFDMKIRFSYTLNMML